MMQAIQLLMIISVAYGLAKYGLFKGSSERALEKKRRADPRQQRLFANQESGKQSSELVTR